MKRFFFLLLVLIMTDSVVSGHSLITSDSTKTTAIEKRILTEEEFRAEYRKILLDLELFSLKSDMYCSMYFMQGSVTVTSARSAR